MINLFKFTISLFLAFMLASSHGCAGQKSQGSQSLDTSDKAPAFPRNMQWLNTDHPLQLKDLQGKIVLLDFWTYSCINCMHIIPDLKKLEHKYKDELVVIGVHSAKHLTEQQTDNIRQAILRYDLEHPVVNDKNMKIWKEYNVRAWPTLVLIGPDGNVAGRRSGENIYPTFNRAIQQLIQKNEGKIDRKPMHFALEKNKTPDTYLSYPGKITADSQHNRLFISDTRNHRIVVTDMDGNIQYIIGSGTKGWKDGSFANAQFSQPEGTALRNNILYIADTDNHVIRKADLENHSVETIAGVGHQVYTRNPSGKALETGLNSPWDVTLVGDNLFIAMAGPHQIWKLNLKTNHISLQAGSGYEGLSASANKTAMLAQPSGITSYKDKLYFASSEASAVQSSDLSEQGKVKIIIGHGLFDFGDMDGHYDKALLQHPMGIVEVNGKLYIADTYNNKIKVIDPERRTSQTFSGFGKEGMSDGSSGKATFNEPEGIDYANGILYVADTNNHLIRKVNIRDGSVSTLDLKGIGQKEAPVTFNRDQYNGEIKTITEVNPKTLKQLQVSLELPDHFKINPLASSQIRIFMQNGELNQTKEIKSTDFNTTIDKQATSSPLYAEMVLYYCRDDNEGLCYIKNLLFEFKNGPGAKNVSHYTINYKVQNSPVSQTK